MAPFPGEAGRLPSPPDRKPTPQTYEVQRIRELRDQFIDAVEDKLSFIEDGSGQKLPLDRFFFPDVCCCEGAQELIAEAGLPSGISIAVVSRSLEIERDGTPITVSVDYEGSLYLHLDFIVFDILRNPFLKIEKKPELHRAYVKRDINERRVLLDNEDLPIGADEQALVEDILVFYVDSEGRVFTTCVSMPYGWEGIKNEYGNLITDWELEELGSERREKVREEEEFAVEMSFMRDLMGPGDWHNGYVTSQTTSRAEKPDQRQSKFVETHPTLPGKRTPLPLTHPEELGEKPKETVRPGRIIGIGMTHEDRGYQPRSDRHFIDQPPKSGTLANWLEEKAKKEEAMVRRGEIPEVVLWEGSGEKYSGSDPNKTAKWKAEKKQREEVKKKKTGGKKHHAPQKHGGEKKQEKEKGWKQR